MAPHRRARRAGVLIHSRLAAELGKRNPERRSPGPVAADRASMPRTAHGVETPRAALETWNTLRAMKLMDGACGEGDWLLEAVRALEPLYAAALQRMAGFQLDGETSRARPALPRGLRTVLSGAGGAGLPRFRAYIHLTTLLYNVAGASSDRAALRIARLRLARALASDSAEEDRVISIILRQRLIEMRPGGETGRTGRLSLTRAQAGEAAALDRAFQVIRDLHLTRRAAPSELGSGYRALQQRIEALAAGASGSVGRSGGAVLRLRLPGHRGHLVTPEGA